ncbi:hypothetical protein [Sphingobacterium wenxiniae]|nr:hypothetical protein [Sphingobacterium wenxiniae]
MKTIISIALFFISQACLSQTITGKVIRVADGGNTRSGYAQH